MEPHPPPGYMARWPQGPMYRPQAYSETNDLKDAVSGGVSSSPTLRARLSGDPVYRPNPPPAAGFGGERPLSAARFGGAQPPTFQDKFLDAFSRSEQNSIENQTENLFQEMEKFPFSVTPEGFGSEDDNNHLFMQENTNNNNNWKNTAVSKRLKYVDRLQRALHLAGIRQSEVQIISEGIEADAFMNAANEVMYETSLISTLARYIPGDSSAAPDSTTKNEPSSTSSTSSFPPSTHQGSGGSCLDENTYFYNNTTQTFQESQNVINEPNLSSENGSKEGRRGGSPIFSPPSTSKYETASGGGVIVPRSGRHLSGKLSTSVQPSSVDSGIGSPRSTMGTAYSPKVESVSPCVAPSEYSPAKDPGTF